MSSDFCWQEHIAEITSYNEYGDLYLHLRQSLVIYFAEIISKFPYLNDLQKMRLHRVPIMPLQTLIDH